MDPHPTIFIRLPLQTMKLYIQTKIFIKIKNKITNMIFIKLTLVIIKRNIC